MTAHAFSDVERRDAMAMSELSDLLKVGRWTRAEPARSRNDAVMCQRIVGIAHK